MNVISASNPYAPRLPLNSPTHLRDVAQRRWTAQREQERKRRQAESSSAENSSVDHLNRIRRLRPGQAAANSLSPVYNIFNESFFRVR